MPERLSNISLRGLLWVSPAAGVGGAPSCCGRTSLLPRRSTSSSTARRGRGWEQDKPETVTDALFTGPGQAVGAGGAGRAAAGIILYPVLSGRPAGDAGDHLRRLPTLAQAHAARLIVGWGELVGVSRRPVGLLGPAAGYDPRNRVNVEWTGLGAITPSSLAGATGAADVAHCPLPTLPRPQFREASRRELERLVRIVKQWRDGLPIASVTYFPASSSAGRRRSASTLSAILTAISLGKVPG